MCFVSWLQHLPVVAFSEAADLPGEIKSAIIGIIQCWARASQLVLSYSLCKIKLPFVCKSAVVVGTGV